VISNVLASWENTLTLHYHYYYNYYNKKNNNFLSNKDRALLFLELYRNNCILLTSLIILYPQRPFSI
jgi:hypothetical protein